MKLRYILGTPFCGSTAVGLVLASAGAHYAGELDRISSLSSNMFPLKSHFCERCNHLGQECSIYSNYNVELLNRIGLSTAFYDKISELTQSDFVIDGSKNADWLRMSFRAIDESSRDSTRAILCVRSPFQFYRSYRATNSEVSIATVGEFWRDSYLDLMKTIAALQIPYLIVRNEDLVTRRSRVLSSVSDFFNIDVQNKDRYDISNLHTVGGNPSFFHRTALSEDFSLNKERSILDGLSRIEVATLLNVPGLFEMANDVFGYALYQFILDDWPPP